jgi:hypothetical protein
VRDERVEVEVPLLVRSSVPGNVLVGTKRAGDAAHDGLPAGEEVAFGSDALVPTPPQPKTATDRPVPRRQSSRRHRHPSRRVPSRTGPSFSQKNGSPRSQATGARVGRDRQHDGLSRLDTGDAVADRLDDASPLVTEDDRGRVTRIASIALVIRVRHTGNSPGRRINAGTTLVDPHRSSRNYQPTVRSGRDVGRVGSGSVANARGLAGRLPTARCNHL